MRDTKGHAIAGIQLLLKRCSFSPSLMVVFNRQFLLSRELKFEKYKYLDLDFMPRFLMQCDALEIVPRVIYRYFNHPPKKGQPRLNDEIIEQLLKMLADYNEMAEHADNKRVREALYYVAHMVLIYILAEPRKKTFNKYVEKGVFEAYLDKFKKVIRRSRYMGDGLKEWCFWKAASFNPLLAKKIFG